MPTLLEMRTRARILADQDASTFPTDEQYNYLINSAVQDVWYDLLHAGMPWRPRVSPATYSASNGALLVSAPTGIDGTGTAIAAVKGVYMLDGGSYRELKRLPEDRRAEMLTATGTPVYYDLTSITSDLNIYLYPVPPNGGTYKVDVIDNCPSLAADSSVWRGPARSEELIIIRAAMRAMRKEGNDQGASFLRQEYDELFGKVIQMANWFHRDAALIRDVNPLAVTRDPFDYDIG